VQKDKGAFSSQCGLRRLKRAKLVSGWLASGIGTNTFVICKSDVYYILSEARRVLDGHHYVVVLENLVLKQVKQRSPRNPFPDFSLGYPARRVTHPVMEASFFS